MLLSTFSGCFSADLIDDAIENEEETEETEETEESEETSDEDTEETDDEIADSEYDTNDTDDGEDEDDTQKPADDTNADVEDTDESIDDTEESIDDTEESIDDTEESIDDTEESIDDTDETVETNDDTKESTDSTDETVETNDDTKESTDDTEETDPIVTPTVDKSELEAEINAAGTKDSSKYTTTSWNNYRAAVETAHGVYVDANATQQDVLAAVSALKLAASNLILKPDKTALKAQIDAVASKKESDYLSSSWSAFKTALSSANTVYNNGDATATEVANALTALKTATNNLVLKPDKTALKSQIDAVSGKKESDYTADSWTTFKSALTSANTVYNDEDATATDVSNALSALKTAASKLTAKPADPEPTLSVFDQKMKEMKATNDAKLAELLPKSEALRNEIKSKKAGYDFGTATTKIGTPDSSWTASDSYWKEQNPKITTSHPRVMITKETIPNVKKMLENTSDPTVQRFYQLLDTVHAKNGQLPAATKDCGGRTGLHNYDKELLELIQIKALAYVVGGHELYGYQAIHYMKQYLRTLDIQYITSNMEREYGNVMFTGALVYDWCYDLLTTEDKNQLMAGIENKTASGTCGYPSYTSVTHYQWKMSIGFPPTKIGAVSGHASERQILRDYLSVAVAFYGDNNSWWNYIGPLVYSEYAKVRANYFRSGLSQQGTGVYVSGRHISDMYSAWILMTSTGSHPFTGIDTTIRNFLGYEIAPGKLFSDGDGTGSIQSNTEFKALSYMSAYMFSDRTLLAQAKDMTPTKAFGADTVELTSALYLAVCGMSDIEPAENKYEGMPLIQYNGSPVGQYVTHEAFGVTDSATVLMRIKERSTANHEHADAGTFMIYYKGMLTADGGVYKGYGSDHTRYYHQATVSHNGLLIYNPNMPEATTDKAKEWYSGGQLWPAEATTYKEWQGTTYLTGNVISRGHGYLDSANTKPLYAYIDGNITSADHADTVDFVGRRMLTVYTQDEDVPMVFFVYDTITADSATYKKTFLLHICSPDAPTINSSKKTVITENGDGRLVLTCLTDGVTITGVGGTNKNYMTNGKQNTVAYETGVWGRVEISPSAEAKSDKFLNAIYVTDKGNTTYYETKPITNVSTNSLSTGDVEGGVFNKSIAAVFVKRNLISKSSFLSKDVSFTTTGNSSMSYYVDGLETGDWQITVGSNVIGTATASNGLLTFTAPAGKVTLTKIK